MDVVLVHQELQVPVVIDLTARVRDDKTAQVGLVTQRVLDTQDRAPRVAEQHEVVRSCPALSARRSQWQQGLLARDAQGTLRQRHERAGVS